MYELLTSWLFQPFDDKLNKMASDTMEDENIVDFVCNRPLEKLIEWLLPPSLGLRVHQLMVTSDDLMLIMASSRSEACCPLCKQKTQRMHSRYTRTLQDLPWGTLRVQVQVQVHRFFCQNPTCPRKITTRAAS